MDVCSGDLDRLVGQPNADIAGIGVWLFTLGNLAARTDQFIGHYSIPYQFLALCYPSNHFLLGLLRPKRPSHELRHLILQAIRSAL